MNRATEIEAILFFKNEPVLIKDLAKLLDAKVDEVNQALENLKSFYKERGVVIVSDGETASFGTHPDMTEFIEKLQKEELNRELGRAGLETLAVILYKGPISRREIDHIRGVNSGYILRTLMIRGLIERVDPSSVAISGAGRSYSYKPTLKLFEYLGITSKEELPEYNEFSKKIEEFEKTNLSDQDE